jgi:predicted anti-sigma-YlaC factor YlaD
VTLVPLNCERTRRQVALAVDQEPSLFERTARAAHLLGCSECRRFAAEVNAFTLMLREAPLERLERPVVVRRARPAWRSLGVVSPAAVAALALAFVGVSSQIPTNEQPGAGRSYQRVSPTVYPTAGELEQEISFVEVAANRSVAFTTNIR